MNLIICERKVFLQTTTTKNNNNNKTLDTGQWNVLPSIRKLCLSHRSQILQKDDEPKQG